MSRQSGTEEQKKEKRLQWQYMSYSAGCRKYNREPIPEKQWRERLKKKEKKPIVPKKAFQIDSKFPEEIQIRDLKDQVMDLRSLLKDINTGKVKTEEELSQIQIIRAEGITYRMLELILKVFLKDESQDTASRFAQVLRKLGYDLQINRHENTLRLSAKKK